LTPASGTNQKAGQQSLHIKKTKEISF